MDTRYQTVKRYITGRITAGEWPPGTRIPSENDLVRTLGISRMTINRAMRELAQEGRIHRLVGSGTFVAERRAEVVSVPIPTIREWIAARGRKHGWRVVETSRFVARPELARLYDLKPGAPLAFVLLLHAENDTPVQLEERFVNLEAAPDFVDTDTAKTLPDDVLARLRPDGTSAVTVEAAMPTRRTADLLEMQAGEPALLVTKRMEAGGAVVSVARLMHPGARFRLGNV